MEAVQDKASPAALCRKTPEAQDLLLAEREGVFWRYFLKAQDSGGINPCDGRAEAVAAVGELAKGAKN